MCFTHGFKNKTLARNIHLSSVCLSSICLPTCLPGLRFWILTKKDKSSPCHLKPAWYVLSQALELLEAGLDVFLSNKQLHRIPVSKKTTL